MPSNPTLTRTSGITFQVMPPGGTTTPPSGDFLIDDFNISFFGDDFPSPIPFNDDLGRVTSTF